MTTLLSSRFRCSPPRSAPALLAGLLGLLQISCAADSPKLPVLRAEPGTFIEKTLGGKEKHEYSLRLEKGRYLDLRIQEKGIEVEVSLADSRGALLAKASPGALDHRDLLLWVTEASGDYRLAVYPRDPGKAPGTYRVEIQDLRPATDKDGARVEALKLVKLSLEEIGEEKTRRQGLAKLEQALRLWRQAEDVEGEVDTLNHIGMGFRLAGNAAAGRDRYEQALVRAREMGYREGAALSLNNIAYASEGTLPKEEVVALYRQSLALWEEIGDEREQAFVLKNLANFLLSAGSYKEARPAFDRGLALADSAGDLGLQGTLWSGVGYIQYVQSDFEGASRSFRRAFDLASEAGDANGAAAIASNLASVYSQLGRLQEAVELLLEAQENVESPETRGYLLHNLGGVYLSLGKEEDGLDAYRQGFEIFRRLGRPLSKEWAARCLIGMGWVFQLRKDPETALRKYQEAHSLNQDLALVKLHLGLVYLDLQDSERALGFLHEALKKAQGNDPALAGLARLALGTAYRNLSRFRLAEEQFDRGYELASANKNTIQMAPFLLRRAMLRRDQGRLAEARADIEAALEIVESTRRNVAGEDLRMSYLASRRGYQEVQIDLLMLLDRLHPGKGYQARALEASEWARARGLRDLLAESKISWSEDIGPDLKQQEARLSTQLSRVQSLLREQRLATSPDGARITGLEQELAELTESRRRLVWEIRKRQRNPEIRPLDFQTIQRGLDDRSVLLEYALGEESSFLFVVTRNGLETHRLPKASTIRERVLRLRKAIKSRGSRTRRIYFEEAYQLYRDLLEPVRDAIAGKENLLIAPDGALYLLPFEVLLTQPAEGSFKDAPYLLRSHAVTYVPSASVLAELRQPRTEPPAAGRLRFVAFADPHYETGTVSQRTEPLRSIRGEAGRGWSLPPLPDSRREVLSIARRYRGASRIYLEREATEENVKQNDLVARAERLHFATHARPDEYRPELSSLILADRDVKKGDDGFLQAYEIFGLKLSADLVVLSACETGLGEEVSGEGLVGLARSFLYAGAPSLVVSLWSISDGATPDLMVSFYEGLDGPYDKAEALRHAKLRMIERGDYHHPFYWAPFILIGDPK